MDTLPWFDQPDAHALIDRMKSDGDVIGQKGLLRQWVEKGLFVIEDLISKPKLEALAKASSNLWSSPDPHDGLLFSSLNIDGEVQLKTSHAEVVALPKETKDQSRKISHFRIGELHRYEEAADSIFNDTGLKKICSMILGVPAFPKYSLTFERGSQQRLHQDMAVFHVVPLNHLIGVWIALEDIDPDSGPLRYFPGSHKEGMYPGFPNYPHLNRRTSDPELSAQYDEDVLDVSRKYNVAHFHGKAGDALFWHGQLIHGGSFIENPALTRRSFVVHFMSENANKSGEITGTKNW